MAELVSTEERYVDDLQTVLEGYRNKLDQTYLTAKTGGFRAISILCWQVIVTNCARGNQNLVLQSELLGNCIVLIVDEIFGNMEDIFTFHSQCLLPKLEYCGDNVPMLARTFSEYSLDICKLYRR